MTMKKLLFTLLVLCGSVGAAHGATAAVPEGLPPGTPAGNPTPVDYISNKSVPLTPREQKALQLSGQWAKTDIPPVMAGGGKIIYVHGAVLPSVIASPMQICDVELQPGEKVNEIVVGDSARWMIESGSAGQGAGQTVHLFIKPVDAGLESTAVITTDRRVYHLRLISKKDQHTPYIGFTYADDLSRSLAAKKSQEQRREQWSTTESADGERTDLSKLNFNYKVSGDRVRWRPERSTGRSRRPRGSCWSSARRRRS